MTTLRIRILGLKCAPLQSVAAEAGQQIHQWNGLLLVVEFENAVDLAQQFQGADACRMAGELGEVVSLFFESTAYPLSFCFSLLGEPLTTIFQCVLNFRFFQEVMSLRACRSL